MARTKLKHPFFVIIGPSGSGKTKVAEAVFPATYKVISHTTRSIRQGEQDGVDYYFETKEQFEHLLSNGALVEHDRYHNHQYGVGINELLQKTNDHYAYDVLTIKGFQTIEKRFGCMVIPIFFQVSKKNVVSRLKIREDNEEIIKERASLYSQETENKSKIMTYQKYVIIDADQPYKAVVTDLKQAVKNIINVN